MRDEVKTSSADSVRRTHWRLLAGMVGIVLWLGVLWLWRAVDLVLEKISPR